MTKTFEHILVPYNGATGSEKAFRKAISLAHSETGIKCTYPEIIQYNLNHDFGI